MPEKSNRQQEETALDTAKPIEDVSSSNIDTCVSSTEFAAAMQHAQRGPHPILIRIDTRAGHGRGKPTTKIIEERADQWSFLSRELEMNPQL